MPLFRPRSATPDDRRFNRDVLWNVVSLAVLAGAGVVVNVVIARAPGYGPDALGVFNQVFAFYIVLSQIAVGGLHLSALKHIAHHQDDPRRRAAICAAALLLAGGLAGAVSLAIFLLREPVAAAWGSPALASGLALAAPGLLLFSLNKVLTCVVNGARHMRAYAVFQALRFVLIVAALVFLIGRRRPIEQLPVALTFAEAVLFLLQGAYVQMRVASLWPRREALAWLRPHLDFGLRGALAGVLTEMNTRVDVLMLGLFVDDRLVGLYSFAAIPAEAFSQLPLVVRRNVDPLIGALFAKGELHQIHAFARRVMPRVFGAMVALALPACLAYPFVVRVVVGDASFADTWPLFAILTAGITLSSGYRAFFGVLLQGGRPGAHTLCVLSVVAANVVLNLALIPLLGTYGAALATALAFMLEAFFIAWFARRLLGVRLGGW